MPGGAGRGVTPAERLPGYRRVHGELAGPGIAVAPSRHGRSSGAGIDPAPRPGGPGWAELPRSQPQAILALDFFTADLLNGTRIYVPCRHRAWHPAGTDIRGDPAPAQAWVLQQARNLLIGLEQARTRVKSVIHHRDASFTVAFDAVFRAGGTRIIRSARQPPPMNSIMERRIGSCRRELLVRTLV
jgi:putative transposase